MSIETIVFMSLIFGICMGGFIYSLILSSKDNRDEPK